MAGVDFSAVTPLLNTLAGGAIAIGAMFVNSRLTLQRDRRQRAWEFEIKRIVELEECAGQLVELIGSHNATQFINENAKEDLLRLERAAGRFRRHKGLMQAIRELHNGLQRLSVAKNQHQDPRETSKEVENFYDKLLAECDAITGKRVM